MKDSNQEKRKYHVNNAIASFELEGEKPSEELKLLLDKYISGEIKTIEELEGRFNSGDDVNARLIRKTP